MRISGEPVDASSLNGAHEPECQTGRGGLLGTKHFTTSTHVRFSTDNLTPTGAINLASPGATRQRASFAFANPPLAPQTSWSRCGGILTSEALSALESACLPASTLEGIRTPNLLIRSQML